MPCAACFNRHKAALHTIHQETQAGAWTDPDSNYAYQDTVQVSTLSQAILDHVGGEKIAAQVKKPLKTCAWCATTAAC